MSWTTDLSFFENHLNITAKKEGFEGRILKNGWCFTRQQPVDKISSSSKDVFPIYPAMLSNVKETGDQTNITSNTS